MLKKLDSGSVLPKALFLFFLSTFCYFISISESDNDLLGHLLFGKIIATKGIPRTDFLSYTAYGMPWINHEWFLEFMWWKTYLVSGFNGLFLFKIVFSALTVAILFCQSRSLGVSLGVAAVVGALSVAAMARGLSIRPQLISYFLFTVELSILRTWQSRSLPTPWLLIPLFIIWTNTHGAFILGLLTLGIFAFFELAAKTSRKKEAVILVCLCSTVTIINPYGVHLYTYIFDELFRPHPITEWAPVSFRNLSHLPFFIVGFVFLLSVKSFFTNSEKRWNVFLSLILLFLAVRHQRHVPTFVIGAWISDGEYLQQLWNSKKKSLTDIISAPSVVLITCAVLGLVFFQAGESFRRFMSKDFLVSFSKEEYPVDVVKFIKAQECTGNIALPLEWGSYTLWHLSDISKVSLDGRFATVYPPEIVKMNFDFFESAPKGKEFIDKYQTDLVLQPKGLKLLSLDKNEWKTLMSDEASELFVRKNYRCRQARLNSNS